MMFDGVLMRYTYHQYQVPTGSCYSEYSYARRTTAYMYVWISTMVYTLYIDQTYTHVYRRAVLRIR